LQSWPEYLQSTCNSSAHCLPPKSIVSEWYAVYTSCRHEKRVALHLEERQIEHFLPLFSSERTWRGGSKENIHLPLFPGYLFVRIHRAQRGRVLSVPGALQIVQGVGRSPASISDATISSLRSGLAERRIEPHSLLLKGRRGLIRSGPFAGMEGVIERLKSGFRVVLTVEQINQSIAIEVAEEDIEPIGSRDSAEMCLI
jgi:transcription termination/antitermination protein NusG